MRNKPNRLRSSYSILFIAVILIFMFLFVLSLAWQAEGINGALLAVIACSTVGVGSWVSNRISSTKVSDNNFPSAEILDGVSAAILVLNRQNNVVYASSLFEEMFGLQRSCILNQELGTVFGLPVGGEMHDALESYEMGDAGSARFEFQHQFENGSSRAIELVIKSVSSDGNIWRVATISDASDVLNRDAEHVRLGAGIQRAGAELERFSQLASRPLLAPPQDPHFT